MAISIGELRGTISLSDQFSAGAAAISKNIGSMGQSFGALTKFAGLAAAGATAVGGAIVALGIHGSKVAAMESSFNALAGAMGMTGEAILSVTRDATKGLISDMDIMAASNKAMLLGLPVTAESMGDMAKAATVLGRAMGQDAKKSLDDMTTALGRSSPLILDNLGITVKVGEANEAYAAKLGISASALTEAQKKTAFYNAAMEAARTKVDELGGIQLTFADRVQIARNQVGNFVDSLGKAVATSPVVAAGMDTIMLSIQGAFGGNQQETIKTLMGFVNSFAITMGKAAELGTGAAILLVRSWDLVKIAFNAVMAGLMLASSAAMGAIATMLETAAELPVVGDKFAGMAKAVRETANAADMLKTQYSEAALGIIENTSPAETALLALKGGIGKAVEAMEAARDAGGEMAAGQEVVKTKFDDTTTAAKLTEAQIKALATAAEIAKKAMEDAGKEIAAKFKEVQDELSLANTEGLAKRLREIDLDLQKRIAGIEHIALFEPQKYAETVEKMKELSGLKTAAVVEGFAQEAAAAGESVKTQVQLAEEALAKAKQNHRELVESGKATTQQIDAAWRSVTVSQMALDQALHDQRMRNLGVLFSSVGGILRDVFGKAKLVAIAEAIVSTYQAIAKTLAAYPWPFSLAPAAAAAAAGWAQVNAIRKQGAGFAQGTPDTRFLDFGRGALHALHGEEAVVTRAQGESLADMVREAVSGPGGGGKDLHVHLYLDGRQVTKSVLRHMPHELSLAGVR